MCGEHICTFNFLCSNVPPTYTICPQLTSFNNTESSSQSNLYFYHHILLCMWANYMIGESATSSFLSSLFVFDFSLSVLTIKLAAAHHHIIQGQAHQIIYHPHNSRVDMQQGSSQQQHQHQHSALCFSCMHCTAIAPVSLSLGQILFHNSLPFNTSPRKNKSFHTN